MQPIIGLDFGDSRVFPSFIHDLDIGTRMGGTAHDLLPARLGEGIPSVYFYSRRVGGALLCENAMRVRAMPSENRLGCLRRHLGETTQLDGMSISYDRAITDVLQHCIRSANKELYNGWRLTTNLIFLSYPAEYTLAQRQYLVGLAENAILEDGTRVKVCGTIAEPAAAALDCVIEMHKVKSYMDRTVLVYNLGKHDFNLSLVAVYPQGRKHRNGGTYYYDIIHIGSVPKLGGAEFDEIMFKLLSEKVKTSLNANSIATLRHLAEEAKI